MHISVTSWVKCFDSKGIKDLETCPDRRRKPIMDCSDEEIVRIAIENDRRSVKKANGSYRQATGKELLESTFMAFLSALAEDIDVILIQVTACFNESVHFLLSVWYVWYCYIFV